MHKALIFVRLNSKAILFIYSPNIGQKTVQCILNGYQFSEVFSRNSYTNENFFHDVEANLETSLCIYLNPSSISVTSIIP